MALFSNFSPFPVNGLSVYESQWMCACNSPTEISCTLEEGDYHLLQLLGAHRYTVQHTYVNSP